MTDERGERERTPVKLTCAQGENQRAFMAVFMGSASRPKRSEADVSNGSEALHEITNIEPYKNS